MSAPARPRPHRGAPPAPGAARPFAFPPFEHRRLTGGLELYAARVGGVPLVSLELLLPAAGAERDPADRAGLAALTAGMLDEGTATASALEIARRAERMGGYLASGSDWETSRLSTDLLSEHLEAGLELLVEAAARPAFPQAELDKLKRRTAAELRSRRARASSRAYLALARGLYPGTPYGGYLLGSEQSIEAATRDDVTAFYGGRMAAPPTLVAVGDLDPDAVALRFEALAGGAFAVPPEPRPAIAPRPLAGIEVHLVDRPGAAQTELLIGHAGLARTDPDWIRAGVLNAVLGGKFVSRINLNLRERHGFTYGAQSRFARRAGPGPFTVGAAVANESALPAAREVLAELARIREAPVEREELDEAKSYLIGSFPYTIQTLDGIAARLAELAVFGLPESHFAELPAALGAVTREDVLEVARRRLSPERALVVAVGPGDQLAAPLAELGEVFEPEL